jgi:DNA replication protein DnaC
VGPAGEPLCLIGDSGTGKSHLLIALGAAAAMAGHRMKYVLAAKLVNELVEAADEKVLNKTIASNESFSGWTKIFTDPRLCAAIVDRLTFGANIIETGTASYRLVHTRNNQHAAMAN